MDIFLTSQARLLLLCGGRAPDVSYEWVHYVICPMHRMKAVVKAPLFHSLMSSTFKGTLTLKAFLV